MPSEPARLDGHYLGLPVIESVQCGLTKVCHNTRCFFWQRDNAGLPPFWYPYDEGGPLDKWSNVQTEFGKTVYPEFTAGFGTNCIHVACMDYTFEDGKSYRELRNAEDATAPY